MSLLKALREAGIKSVGDVVLIESLNDICFQRQRGPSMQKVFCKEGLNI